MSTEEIDKSFDSILSHEENDVALIPEQVFKTTILPMIANNDETSADFQGWLIIAGSWRRPIDVTDDQSGEVLFRVPALVGENDLPIEQQGVNSAYEVIQNARRKMRTLPKAGEEHLIRGLRPRIRVRGDLTENQKRWNYIYERYGLETRVGDGSTEAKLEAGPDKPSNPDVVGYDEI